MAQPLDASQPGGPAGLGSSRAASVVDERASLLSSPLSSKTSRTRHGSQHGHLDSRSGYGSLRATLSTLARPSKQLARTDSNITDSSAYSYHTPVYQASISTRRQRLQRQDSFGEAPNQVEDWYYDLKDWAVASDSSNEKVASTLMNVVNLIVDFSLCVLYLIEASGYTRPAGHEGHRFYIQRSDSLWYTLVSIAAYNLSVVSLSIVFSEQKSNAIRSSRHIISTMVALPFIFSIFMKDGQHLYVPYFLQVLSLISRVAQALNFYLDLGVSDLPIDVLKSKIIMSAAYILALIYCSVSAFQFAEYEQLLENDDQGNLLKLLYFVMITTSTIGYGDISPRSPLGYAVVICIIFAVVTIFPWLISGIMDALAEAKAGEGIFKSGGNKFMIVSGSLNSAQKLSNVLNGFWFTNKEYSSSAFKILLFSPNEPSKEIQALLSSARYKNRVSYLKGTPLKPHDLDRIQARFATGIFVISDRNSSHSALEEDRHNTLSALAFRNVSNAGIYTYNILPETEMYQKTAATQIICADEVRQVLLGFNCLQQATATLILNLLHQHRPSDKPQSQWESEYDDSLGNEFYTTYLNPIFVGKPFSFVSWFLYRRFQVMLVGVRIKMSNGEYHTALNPGNYLFKNNEQCIFIAQSFSDLEEVTELTEKHIHNYMSHMRELEEEESEEGGGATPAEPHAQNFNTAIETLLGRQRPPGSRNGRWKQKSKNNKRPLDPSVPTIPGGSSRMAELHAVAELDSEGSCSSDDDAASIPVSSRPPSNRQRHDIKLFNLDRLSEPEHTSINLKEQHLWISHPTSPYAGAKVPLCFLNHTLLGQNRLELNDFVIDDWADVLEKRRHQADVQGEFLTTHVGSVDEPGELPTAVQEAALGHILICSPNYDIFRLICTLRSAHLKKLHDIVILCSRLPNPAEFRLLRCFPKLFFLVGDCLSRPDLERGAIGRCSKYLFLRDPHGEGVDPEFFDGAAVINRIVVQQIFSGRQKLEKKRKNRKDNKAIAEERDQAVRDPFSTGQVVHLQNYWKGPQCVYELLEERSVDYLQIRKQDDEARTLADSFCNDLLASSDTVLTAAGLPQGLNHVHQQNHVKPQSKAPDFYHNPIYASGGVLVGGLLDHVLYQVYSNPSILQIVKLFCGIRTKLDLQRDKLLFKSQDSGCYLECIPVPQGFGADTSVLTTSSSSESFVPASHYYQRRNSSDMSSEDDHLVRPSGSKDSTPHRNNDHHQKNHHYGLKAGDHHSKEHPVVDPDDTGLYHQGGHTRGDTTGSTSPEDKNFLYRNRHLNFLHLYEHLALDKAVIPIGLLRLQGDDPTTIHVGIGGSRRCYVITNPLLDTVVLDTDKVWIMRRIARSETHGGHR